MFDETRDAWHAAHVCAAVSRRERALTVVRDVDQDLVEQPRAGL